MLMVRTGSPKKLGTWNLENGLETNFSKRTQRPSLKLKQAVRGFLIYNETFYF